MFFNEIKCKKSLISNTIYGRRHLKLFTNCQVRGTPCNLFLKNRNEKVNIKKSVWEKRKNEKILWKFFNLGS